MRRGIGALVFALVVVVVIAVALQFEPEGRPYDLDGNGEKGYLAVRLLLDEGGTRVDAIDADEIGAGAVARHPVSYIPVASAATGEQARAWTDYVVAGGVLVLGTPVDGLGQPEPTDEESEDDPFGGFVPEIPSGEPGVCDLVALGDVGGIAVPVNARAFEVEGRRSCFGDGETAAITEEPLGDGLVVNLATPDLFTNETLGAPSEVEPAPDPDRRPDNGYVAMQLLGRADSVAVVTSGVAGSVVNGTKEWTSFISTAKWAAMWQLAAAFCWYAWHRARRHGQVVDEPLPVRIEGSDYVLAVGNLLRRQGNAARAAETLRGHAAGRLARDLGLPIHTDVAMVAAALAHRSGRSPDEVLGILRDHPIVDDPTLAALAEQIRQLQQEALHVRAPNPA